MRRGRGEGRGEGRGGEGRGGGGIGACRPRHTWALPGLFRIMGTHITRTGRKDMWSPAYSLCMHRCTHSLQCSDKMRFPQLRIKCGIAKSCPGTHTALQAPIGGGRGGRGGKKRGGEEKGEEREGGRGGGRKGEGGKERGKGGGGRKGEGRKASKERRERR